MKVKPINPKLKPLLEEFLTTAKLQPTFEKEARRLGYLGNDPELIRVALFTPAPDGEICFADQKVEDLFVDFQIRKILRDLGVPDDLDDATMSQLIQECRQTLLDMNAQEQQ